MVKGKYSVPEGITRGCKEARTFLAACQPAGGVKSGSILLGSASQVSSSVINTYYSENTVASNARNAINHLSGNCPSDRFIVTPW